MKPVEKKDNILLNLLTHLQVFTLFAWAKGRVCVLLFCCLFLFTLSPTNLIAQTFRSAAQYFATTGVNSLTINKPTGTVNGDVMIAAIGIRPNTASITAPSGWTLIKRTDQSGGTASSQALYWKAAGSSEPSNYTWTFSSSTGSAGGIATFYNVNTANPVNVSGGQATGSALAHSTPSVTTTATNTMVIAVQSFASCATWTPPAGMTEIVDVSSDAVPNAVGISLNMSWVRQAAIGATNAKSATASGDADVGVAQIVALNSCTTPAAPTVTTPVNYCQNATATQLTATGSSLVWGNGGIASGTAGGTAALSTTTWIDGQWGPSTLYTTFSTLTSNVEIESIDYTIPAWQGVTGLRLSLYNSSGTLLANSSTVTTSTNNTATAVKISNVFNYTIATAGNYTIKASAGYGNIGGDVPSYPVTEPTGTINLTGHTGGGYRTFNNIQFNYNSGSVAPTPSTTTVGTTNYSVTQTVNGCVSPAATIAVVVNAMPSATISYSGTPFCRSVATAQSVTRSGTTGGTYTASPAGLSINSSTGAITPSASTAGTYTVTYTMNIAGCGTRTATASVTINNSPTVSGSSTSACVGGSTGTITASASGGTTPYTYSINGGAYQSSATFTGLAANTYTLNVRSNNGCIASTAVVVSPFAAATDNQNTAGTDSWTGHGYDGVAFDTYYGWYNVAENFNENFGGTLVCFPVTGNGITQSLYTETFSVRYRMNSTKRGLYVTDLGSDDGSRLSVDGSLVYNNWVAQGFTSRPRNLFNLTGSSSLVYEFFENSGGNQIAFQNLTLVLANTLSANTSQNICTGLTGVAITGDEYGVLPTGVSLSGTGYQWCYSTSPGGSKIDIAGATGSTFIPDASIAPFNIPGTYYLYRKAILVSTNNTGFATYTATNESNAATVIVSAPPSATISYSGSPYCSSSGTATVTRAGTAGGSYSSATLGAALNNSTGAITLASAPAGVHTVTYTVAAAGGCSVFTTTASITITEQPFANGYYAGTPYCSNGGFVAPTVIEVRGASGTLSSTAGLIFDGYGQVNLGASTPGSYMVTYTVPAQGGCAQFTYQTPITITAAPSATISYAGTPYCNLAGTANVTHSGTVGGSYSSTAGLSISATTGAVNLAASTPGTYTVTYTIAAAGGCAQYSTSTTIVLAPLVNNTLIFGTPGILCQTPSEGSNAVLTAPAGSYFSTVDFASYGTPTGSCGAFVKGTCHSANSQAVSENYLLGNSSATIPATNAVFTDPCGGTVKRLYVQAVYNTPICSGTSPGTIIGSAPSGGNGSYTYLWEISTTSATAGFAAAPGINNEKDYTPAVLTQTTWFKRTVTSNGCSDSKVILVLVNPAPAATISYAGSPYCSSAGTATVTHTGTTGGTYSSTTGLSIDASTGAVNLAASTAGTYSVTYTIAAAGGCGVYTTTTSITITQQPRVDFYYPATPYCSNGGVVYPSATILEGAVGSLSGTPSLVFDMYAGVNLAASTPGQHTMTYTVPAQGGCSVYTYSSDLFITAAPSATISYGGSSFCHSAGTISVNLTGTTGGTYSGTAGLSINSATGEVNITASTPGTHTVTYTVAATANCAAFSTTVTISILEQPVVTTAVTKSICSGSVTDINLEANTLSDFSWTTGTIAGGISGASAGSGKMINQILTNSGTTAGSVQYIVAPVSKAQAYTGTVAAGNQVYSERLGLVFTANSPITVTSLGVFDDNLDGITGNIQVGIIRNSDGVTVAGPITITGNADRLEGNHRIRDIAPVTLPLGTYTIVAVGFGTSDRNVNATMGGGAGTVLNTGAGLVTYNSSSYGGAGFGVPTVAYPQNNVFHAGTFGFSTGCAGPLTTITVTVNPTASMPGAILGPSSICQGSTGINYTIAPVPAATGYQWTLPTGWTITAGAGTNSITVSTGEPGEISVIAQNGCGNSTASSLSVTFLPVEVVATTGVVNSCYATVKNAFDKINDGTHRGDIQVKLRGNTVETVQAALNASGTGSASYNSVHLFPETPGVTVEGAIDNNAIINLNGADNVIIDGRVNATGTSRDLVIQNTSTTLTSSTIRMIGGAESNVIRYAVLKGASSGNGGVLFFSTAGTLVGNNNNLVEHNDITSIDQVTRASHLIYSAGTSGRMNINNAISNNNFFNFLDTLNNSAAINLATNSSDFTITNNSFYQTTAYVPSNVLSKSFSAIRIVNTSGNNFIITNNYIGGSAPQAGGAPMVIASETPHSFRVIDISAGTTVPSSIQNNVIANIEYSSNATGGFTGIYITGGNVNVGTVTGNIIGASTGNGSLALSYSNTAATATSYGISANGTGEVKIANNTIGSVTTSATATSSHTFRAIYKGSSAGTVFIQNNLVGSSSTPNSIQASTPSSAGAQSLYGISSAGIGDITITGNTISNMDNAYAPVIATTGQVVGIYTSGVGRNTISGNTVTNLASATLNTSATNAASVIGIADLSTGAGKNISQNNIYGLINTSVAGVVSVTGLYVSGGTTGEGVVSGNTIYNLHSASNSNVNINGVYYTAPATGTNILSNNFVHSINYTGSGIPNIYGIRNAGGTSVTLNNIISLGHTVNQPAVIYGLYETGGAATTNQVYFNTVSVGGSTVGSSLSYAMYNNTTANNRDIRNNIFTNTRSSASGLNHHFAIRVSGTTNLTIDHNNYFVSGTAGTLARLNTTNYASLATWTSAMAPVAGDSNSLDIDPLLVNASGTNASDFLSKQILTGVEGTGVTTDYFGSTRIDPPKMGAIDCSANPKVVATTPAGTCNSGSVTIVAAASPGAIIHWYDSEKRGALVGTGDTLITPVVSESITYFAEAVFPECRASYRVPVQVTITPQPSATIAYSQPAFCSSTPGMAAITLNGTAGGAFTSTPVGLSLNAATGEVNFALSNPTTRAYSVTYSIPAIGGCDAFDTSTTITITEQPYASGFYPGNPYCSSTGILYPTVSALRGPYGTVSSTAGLIINGYGGVDLGASAPGSYTVTYTVQPTGGCGLYVATAPITILQAGKWIGTTSSAWATASNWECGGAPTTAINVVIPAGTPYQPIASSSTNSAKNITIASGASITVSGGLQIAGSITNNGTFNVQNGEIEMRGTTAQTIPANAFQSNSIKSLIVNNLAGVTLGGALNVTDALAVWNGWLNTGGHLTLKSNAAKTARVDRITSADANPIRGEVTVERYIPGRRKYRIMTSSVTTSAATVLTPAETHKSIWGHWQNAGDTNQVGIGTFITGGTEADGFDQGTTNPSFFTYDAVNRKYTPYTSSAGNNTKFTPLKAGVPYYMFVYGHRKDKVYTSTPGNTVLQAKGTLLTGDQVYDLNSTLPLNSVVGKFTMIGNPFASPINWTLIPKVDVEPHYWGWDPNLNSTGGYVTVSEIGNIAVRSPYTGNAGINEHIQAGQGFFVRTLGANPSLTIREMDKSNGNNTNAFRNTTLPLLAVNLFYKLGSSMVMVDGAVSAFNDNYSKAYSSEDALKMENTGETLAIQNGQLLSLDVRPLPTNDDTLFLNTSKLVRPQYFLQVFPENLADKNVQPFLEDTYLKTLQTLSVSDTTYVSFTIKNSDPASYRADRFRIIFKKPLTLPVKFVAVKADKKDEGILINWSVAQEAGIVKYIVEGSTNGSQFYEKGEVPARNNANLQTYSWLDILPAAADNFYRIRAVNADGSTLVSHVVVVKMDVHLPAMNVYPNPIVKQEINIELQWAEKGKYNVILFNQFGQQVLNTFINHNGGTAKYKLPVKTTLAAQVYFLKVAGSSVTFQQQVMVE